MEMSVMLIAENTDCFKLIRNCRSDSIIKRSGLFSRLSSGHFSSPVAQYDDPSHGFCNVYAHECLDAGGYLYCRQQFSGFCWWYPGRCIPGFGECCPWQKIYEGTH